jgi:hypothetical protein
MNCNLSQNDQEKFDELEKTQDQFKECIVKMLMNEMIINEARGTDDNRKIYRKNVLSWINEYVNNNGKNEPDHFRIEYEFEVKNEKKRKVMFSDQKIEIPENVLRTAFLSGKNSRLTQFQVDGDPLTTQTFSEISNSDNVVGFKKIKLDD